ncbi:MAG: RNA methyltransferase [Candidatus Puniceispirillaceae bacterium]
MSEVSSTSHPISDDIWQAAGYRPPVVILARPQMGENIGASARAMKNCGLIDLRLVAPRDGWPNPAAEPMAASGKDIIAEARVYDTLAAACHDISFMIATSARPRDLAKPVCGPREAAGMAVAHHTTHETGRVAFLFGSERSGLDNDELALADLVATADLNPKGMSLNLAQAVMVMGWEWRMACLLDQGGPFSADAPQPADIAEREFFFTRLEEMLEARGFFTAPEMAPIVKRNLRTLFGRAAPSHQELRTLHGVLTLFARAPRDPK